MANRTGQARRRQAGVASGRMTERGRPHTIQEWLNQPPERRLELIDGEFIEKAAPDLSHGNAQAGLTTTLRPVFNRKPGGAGPGAGGWWILTEVDIQLGNDGFRPDVAGWRRERMPTLTEGRPVILRPDWICEVLSEWNSRTDTIRKLRRYHDGGVPHYWLLDPATGTLGVFRHETQGYLNVLTAERGQLVRAEPFDAIEINVAMLLGDDPE